MQTLLTRVFHLKSLGPRQANLVLIAYASSEGSGEPAHPRSLARTFAARSYNQWIKRNLQTENQIPGPSEWLGMRSWNLSWRNARSHKFAWRGPLVIVTPRYLMLLTLSTSVPSKLHEAWIFLIRFLVSRCAIFLSAASYCIWQVEISYPISLPSNPIDQYPSEVSSCLLHP